MNKKIIFIINAILIQVVHAAPINQFVTADYEYRNYSNDRGHNNLTSLAYGAKFNQGSIVAKVANSVRRTNKESDAGTLGSIDLYYNWNDWFSTKTGVSVSDGNSTFLHNEIRQDFSFKPKKKLVLTVGGKHTEYGHNVKVNAALAGFSYYYKDRAIISYKYSYFNSKDRGSSQGNTISFKLKDTEGSGNTQLWLGFGTGAYSYEWNDDRFKRNTNFKSVTLRREQPISKNWTLGVAGGKNWYDTPIDKYTALQAKVDLTYKW